MYLVNATLHAFASLATGWEVCSEIGLTGFLQRFLLTYLGYTHMRTSRECPTQGKYDPVRGRGLIQSLKDGHVGAFCLEEWDSMSEDKARWFFQYSQA